jgi:hypothetical protein
MSGYSDSDLAALQRAYAAGTLRVRFADGREVYYGSEADLLARIREVERALGATASQSRPRKGLATFSKGYHS